MEMGHSSEHISKKLQSMKNSYTNMLDHSINKNVSELNFFKQFSIIASNYFKLIFYFLILVFSIFYSNESKAQCTPSPAFGGTSNGAAGNIFITTAKFNSTTFYSGGTAGANPYTNLYSSVTGNVTAGQAYTFNMSSSAASSASYYTCFYAWIDWNNNGLFTDAGENIMGITVPNPGSLNVTSPSFTVGAGLSGDVKMRIAVMGGGFGSIPAIAPCAGQGLYYGEFKDFKVTITPGVACSGTPSSLVVTPASTSICAVSTTSIALTLNASGYTYQWQESNVIGGPYVNVTGGSGATTATFTTPTGASLPYTTTYYRCNVTCTASGQTTASQISTVSLNSFLNCYCTPTFNAANGGTRGITQVILNGSPTALNNVTTVNSVSPYYSLYTSQVADLALSASYTLQVKVGSQALSNHRAAAWIDYNQNGVFETTEFIGAFAAAVAPNATGSIAFTVPGTALTGTTSMRVIGRFGTTNTITNAQACATFGTTAANGGAGEVEDYRVNISGSACSGTPTAGNVYAGSSGTNTTASACPSATTTMYATGYTTGVSGINLQWQVATSSGGPYSNVVGGSGANTANYTTASLTNAGLTAVHYYYKCLITCTNGGATAIQTTPLDVTVNPTPSVTINGSAPYNSSICNTGSPNSIALTGANAAAGATTWSWSPATGLSATNISNPSANPSTTTTYTLTATANTCVGTANSTITVNPAVVTASASPSTIGLGQTSTLTASTTSSNGAISYSWSPVTALYIDAGLTTPYNVGDFAQTVYSTTLSTATYTVTASDPSGCSRTGTVTVNVSSGSPGTVSCGYAYSYGPTGSYATAASLGTPTTLIWADDQVYTNKSIGFTFNFNDAPYSTMGISSNGFIWFGTGTCSSTQYNPISSTAGQSGTVDGIASVYGTDMGSFTGASLKYVTFGTAGSRTCVIEWASVGVDKVGVGSPGAQSDFQIRLYEGTNKIEFFYRCSPYDLTFVGGLGVFSAQTGIRGSLTSDYLNRTNGCEGPWASTTAGVSNTDGMSLAGGWNCASSWPVTGRIFVYTPTTKPTITPTGQQNVCTGSPLTLTAVNSGGMSSPTYQWQTYAWPPSNSNIGGQTSSTYSPSTATAGNYFYTVKLTSGSCSRNSDAVAVVVSSCNTITTSNVAVTQCPGSAISVSYTVTGSYTGGNIFTAQLSDASGSFASPVTIGTLTSTASGTITAGPGVIPAGALAGLGYKIRVISSTPAIVGSETTPFEILEPSPIISVTNPPAGCSPGTVDITASGIVNVTNGVLVSGITYWTNLGATTSYTGDPSAVSVASTIYVKYANTCGNDVKPIVVTFKNPIITSDSKTNPTTCAGSNGTITLNGLVPSTSYTVLYQKNGPPNVNAGSISTNVGGSLIITGLGDGAYDNIVLTLAGCSSTPAYPSSGFIALNDPAAPSVSGVSTTNPTTCAGNDGSIQLNGLLASTSYTVNYDRNTVNTNAGSILTNGGGSLIINNLTEGNYDNIVVSLSGCNSSPTPSSGVIALVPPSSPSIGSYSPVNPSTCGGSNGSITLNGLSVSTSYTLTYIKGVTPVNAGSLTTNGSGALVVSGLTEGSYNTFVVTNALGCYSPAYPLSGNLVLSDPAIPVISSFIAIDPTTCSGTNGTIQLSGLSNSTSYSVSYKKNSGATINAGSITSNGSGVLQLSGLGQGDYDNIIVSINGCNSDPYPVSGSISLFDPAIPSAPTGIPSQICGTGSLLLDATDAIAGEDYKWYDASSGGTLLQSTGSSYTTTVISSTATYYVTIYNTTSGCESTTRTPVIATVYAKPISTISGSLSGCASSGTVLGAIGSSAGSGSISGFQWQLGGVNIPLATSNNYTASTSGNYTLIVSNTNGCNTTSAINAVSISQSPTASGSGTFITCENGFVTLTGITATNGTINWTRLTGNGALINTSSTSPTYSPAPNDAGTIVTLRMTVSNSPCADATYDQTIIIEPRPVVNPSSATINASNSSQALTISNIDVNSVYHWSPASDLYMDASLTIPYVLNTHSTTVYAAPFSTVVYHVTATSSVTSCTSGATAVLVNVDPALTNDICLADQSQGLVTVTNTPVFVLRSLAGATASPGAACVGIDKDIWFRSVVPSNGEIHVITQEHNNPIASLNITSALVQIFTATTCSTGLSQVACNSGGAAANMAYAAASGLTPGTTVYIRLARTTAGNAAPAQYLKMAVTNGLIWTGAIDNNFSNPANWVGGDATALTTPSASSTVIIPTLASNVYPTISGTQNAHGIEFVHTLANGFTPSVLIFAGSELRLTASSTYKSFITRSGNYANIVATAPKISGQGTLRFNEGGLNSGAVQTLIHFYGVVAVRAGVSVTSNGNMSFENNSVLLSGGVATGDLTKNYSGNVIGNIIYKRNGSIYGGYNYWGSPVTGASTNSLQSTFGNNIYAYDNMSAGGSIQGAWGNPITTPVAMLPGKGYIQTYAGNGNVTFTGTPNESTYNFPVTVNVGNNFNLLSNPYPSALSYNLLRSTNSNLGSVYLWSFAGSFPFTSNSYVVLSGLGVLSGNPVPGFNSAEISAGQGFFAQVSGAGTVSFNSNQRVPNYPGNSTQFLDNDSPYSILRLRLTNPNQISFDAVVGFGETGTDGVDFGFDSPRMPSSDVLELYTMLGDGQFTTQYLPVLNAARVIDLGVVMATAGTYSFDLNLFDNFDPTVRVFLEDRKTSEFHNLNAASNYSFTNDPAFVGTRFRLHFMAPFAYSSTGSCTNENTGKVILSNPNQNYPMQARIKNTAGEVVMAKDSVMAEYIFTGLAPQSYSMETSYDGTEFNSTLIDIQGFEAFENAGITSSASSISLDKAIVEFSTVQIAGAEYTWNFGDQTSVVAGANVSHAYMQTGIYTVTLSISNGGCTSTSSYEIAITDDVTGIANVTDGNQLIAFPNPANELVKILRSDSRQAVLELTDITGKVVLRKTLTNTVETISTSDLKAGTYLAVIRDNKTTRTIRVVVTH